MPLRKIKELFYFSVSRSDYYIAYNLLSYLANKKNLKIKKKIISHIKIKVPVYKSKNLPTSLKLIPIQRPGSRRIK